jgi:WD40 repeat protein
MTVACTLDGKLSASVSNVKSRNVIVRSFETDKELAALTHPGKVNTVAISPDGKLIATGGDDYDTSLNVWDWKKGTVVKGMLTRQTVSVFSVAFSPDSQLVASGGSGSLVNVKVFSLVKGHLATLEGHSGTVLSVVFSSDGKLIASGSQDHTVNVWSLETQKLVKTLTGHSDSVFSVVFSPDGKLIASGSRDKSVKVWDLEKGQVVRTLTGHLGSVQSVAFSSDGKLIASGGIDRSVNVWSLETGQLYMKPQDRPENVYFMAFNPEGKLIVSGKRQSEILSLEHPSKSVVDSLIKDVQECTKRLEEQAAELQVTVDKKRKALCADEERLQKLHKQVEERKGRTKVLRALIVSLC